LQTTAFPVAARADVEGDQDEAPPRAGSRAVTAAVEALRSATSSPEGGAGSNFSEFPGMTWVGACVVAEFLLGALIGSVFSRQRENSKRDESHADKLDYPTDANQETSIAALARAQIALAKDTDAASKSESDYSKKAYRVNLWTAVGVGTYTVFTAVIVIFSIIQYGETHRFNKKQLRFLNAQLAEMRGSSAQTDQSIAALTEQAGTMAAQLTVSRDEFIATQRPWVSLDSKPTITSLYVNEGGDISFNAQFTFFNSGRTPAIHVFPSVAMVLMTTSNLSEIITKTMEFCQRWRNTVFSQTESGILVPPNKPIIYPDFMAGGVPREEVQRTKARVGNREAVVPYIGGCINYQFTFGEKKRHQTGFIYHLLGPESMIFLEKQMVPDDQIILYETGGGWAD
jgi:hypothetical protein